MAKTTMTDYWRRRVQRGAFYLDMTVPGWWKRIDLVTLRLNDGCECIVGQLANFKGHFDPGFASLFPGPTHLAYEFGVDDSGVWHAGYGNRFALLTALWTDEINERLALDEAGKSIPAPTKRQQQQAKARA